MIRWPWVSRRAYDEAVAERTRLIGDLAHLREQGGAVMEERADERARFRADLEQLREQNAKLLEHITRIVRAEHGLSEVPRTPRPALQPMPKELLAYCNAFQSPSNRKDLRDRALRAHAAGRPWAEIKKEMMPEEAKADGA